MRLFRRRQDSPTVPDPAPEAPVPDGEDVARPERAPTGDWMTVPPLPATVRPMTPTFRVQTLPEILTSHQSVRLSGDLGHSVSPEAPSGSVQGLAVTNPGVHEVIGHGDLPLRTPHLPEPAPVQPITIRRLAISDSPEPAAAPAPALPEPVVSRVLANPAPLANPPAAPLPVARVVESGLSAPTDAPAPSSSASSASSASPSVSEGAASPAADPAPASGSARDPGAPGAGAPLVGDDRVGGFSVNLDALGAADSNSQLRRPAPPELAPPIQPRTRQRRADPLTPPLQRSTSGAAGSAVTPPSAPEVEMPLAVSRDSGPATGGAAPTDATAASTPLSATPDSPGNTTSSSGGSTAPGPSTSTPTGAGAGAISAAEPAGTSMAGATGAMATSEPAPSPEPLPVQTAPLVGEAPPVATEAAAPAEPAEPAPAAPLVLRQPATPVGTEDPPVSTAPAATTADAPLLAGELAGASPPVSEPADTLTAQTSSAADVVPVGRVKLPLHTPAAVPRPGATPSPPAVQRLAEPAGPSASSPAAASPPTAAASASSAAQRDPVSAEDPASGTAAASASSAAQRDPVSAEDPASGEAVIAPLAGENLLRVAEPAAAAAASPSVASTQDLPLVVRRGTGDADPAPSSTAGDTTAGDGDSPRDEPLTESAVEPAVSPAAGVQAEPMVVPTLGMGGGDLALQTSPDTSSSGIAGITSPTSAPPLAGVSGLPLAPLEQPGTLGAPAPAGPSAQASGSPLPHPLAAPSAGRGASPTATTAPPLQRVPASPAAAVGSTGTGTSTTTVGPLQTTLQLPAPVVGGAPPASPTSLPLQRLGAVGAPAATAALSPAWSPKPRVLARAGAPAPLDTVLAPSTALAAPPVAAGAPVLRRLPATAGPNGTGAGGPSTNVQRIDGAGAPTSTNGAAISSSTGTSGTAEPLPLHTPAAAVPSAADVAVKAGLAERQADGSLLYTSPPGGAAAPETVIQRVNGTATATAAPGGAEPADLPPGAATPAAGAPGAGAGGADQSPEELDLLARRLYKRLRSEMQADIAKQLEAKNRAGRYRR